MPRIVLAALTGLLMLPAAAGAARPWAPATTIAADGRLASAAIDDDGEVLVAWTRPLGRATLLRARRRTAGGAFGAARELRFLARGDLGAPAIGFAGGRAYLAWQRGDRIEGRTLASDGARGDLQRITGSPPAATGPELLRSGAGPLVLTWRRGSRPARFELAAARGGRFIDRRRYLLPAGDLAVDAQGGVSLAYVGTPAEGLPRVYVARRAPGDTDFSVPVAVSDGQRFPREPAIAVTPAGEATVAWTESDGRRERVVAAESGGVVEVLADGILANGTEAVATASGDVFVTWREQRGGAVFGAASGPVRLAVVGSARPPRTLGGVVSQYTLRADGPGGATVAWVRLGGRVEAVAIGRTGTPGRVQRLSRPGAAALTVSLATGRRGDAFAVWTRRLGRGLTAPTRIEGALRPADR